MGGHASLFLFDIASSTETGLPQQPISHPREKSLHLADCKLNRDRFTLTIIFTPPTVGSLFKELQLKQALASLTAFMKKRKG
jgi:hypothetical protein